MYAARKPDKQIDRYTGPYERWVFSEELGKPFAFPAIRDGKAQYFTALLDGGRTLPEKGGLETRLPPLWKPEKAWQVTPFAFYQPDEEATQDVQVASTLMQMRESEGQGGKPDARFRVNFPIAEEAWAQSYAPEAAMEGWAAPKTPPRAIIAVIDDGLPFAHEAFLDADGKTRVSHIWLQSAPARSEEAVPFGRELRNGEIDALRSKHTHDEAALYRDPEAGGALSDAAQEASFPAEHRRLRHHATHGAHVMGMAAGNDSRLTSHPMGDDIQIIAVQLPASISWDTSGFGKDMYMLSALHYIFERARAIAAEYAGQPDMPQELPLIVNLSYGWSANGHDGASPLERAFEEMLQERKALQPATELVMPMGNNFDQDMHGQITAGDLSGGSYSFGWHLQPDDKTSSYLEIWLPKERDYDGWHVSVTPPEGYALVQDAQIEITADDALMQDRASSPDEDPQIVIDTSAKSSGDPRRFEELALTQGQNIGQLSADKVSGKRWRVMLALIPTTYVRGEARRAPSGQWTITVTQNADTPLSEGEFINIWVQRDDDPVGMRAGGRQSRLVDLAAQPPKMPHPLKAYTQELGFLRGYGCYNALASAPSVVRVAGYMDSTQRPSAYSGAHGLKADSAGNVSLWGDEYVKTTLSAVADQSQLMRGTGSIGVLSGSSAWLVGTSGAAPQAARLMALNAAEDASLPLTRGMAPALPLAAVEESTDMTEAKHLARVGSLTAPLVGRKSTSASERSTKPAS